MIRFKRREEKALLHNPLKGFEIDSQPIEYREDPISGLTSFVRTGRAFFPNLFAHKRYSAIITTTEKHYLKLDEFEPGLLINGFKLADLYIRRAHEKSGVEYAEIGGNYLYPGGSSVVHPHIQVIASHEAHYLMKVYIEKGKTYHRKYSQNFWEELVNKEKQLGERYLGKMGSTEWFTPFAPIREDEVDAVVRGKSNFLEFEDHDWQSLAQGLSRVLKAYNDKGLSCFNFAIYSGPLSKKLKYLWAGIKIVSRSSVQPYPVSDTWYSNCILLDGFVVEPPEQVAKEMRPYFA